MRLHWYENLNIYLDKKAKEQQSQKASRKIVDIPQLVQELEVKLGKGKVECMICYDMVEGICSYGLIQLFFQFFICFESKIRFVCPHHEISLFQHLGMFLKESNIA
jgi:hypothetical protein